MRAFSAQSVKQAKGFTLVELLIVIVVIAILAAISIVAYNGIQERARDNTRYQDAKAIMKALELYKVDHGSYPVHSFTASAKGCNGNGYSYSWATDGSWLKKLVDGGYLQEAPTPPVNDCSRNYRYLRGDSTSYGCAREHGWYMLQIVGAEGTSTPSEAKHFFQPCTGAPGWGTNSSTWTFAKDDV